MSAARPAEILRQLEQSGLTPSGEPVGDGELLARFARDRDQSAFAAIVRRHGPMVLTVCKRITAQPQDAEDAFQAAFLVLAQKVGRIRSPELLGNWLYGVAVRTAQKARRSAIRRRAREVQVVDMPESIVTASAPDPDVGSLLYEELAALPVHYREALVLCELRGVSRGEAARALGVPEGTLSSRLAGGRKKLAERLTRRGVALSAAAVAATLANDRAAAGIVPDPLVSNTCRLVADWAAVPPSILRLAKGGFSVRKTMALGVVTAALTATGLVFAGRPTDSGRPADPPKPPEAVAAVAEPEAAPTTNPKPNDNTPEFTSSPRMRKALGLPIPRAYEVCWSPDGKGMAVQTVTQTQVRRNEVVVLPDVFASELQFARIELPKQGTLVGFTPDGNAVVTDQREYNLVSGFHRLQFWAIGPMALMPGGPGGMPGPGGPGFPSGPGGLEGIGPMGPGMLGIPSAGPKHELRLGRTVDLDSHETHGYYFAPDGKTFRTVARQKARSTPQMDVLGQLEVREVSAATGETLRTVFKVDGEFKAYALSPGGVRLAAIDATTNRLTVWNVSTGKAISAYDIPVGKVEPEGLPDSAPTIIFSPDGRQVVCFRAIQPSVHLDADKGEPLAPLEDTTRLTATGQFTADGRLLAVYGHRLVEEPHASLPGVRPPEVGEPKAEGPGFGPPGQGRGRGNPKLDPGGGPRPRAFNNVRFIGVWDTTTGKRLRGWDHDARVAAHPSRPLVAIAEENQAGGVRLGLWDFAKTPGKK